MINLCQVPYDVRMPIQQLQLRERVAGLIIGDLGYIAIRCLRPTPAYMHRHVNTVIPCQLIHTSTCMQRDRLSHKHTYGSKRVRAHTHSQWRERKKLCCNAQFHVIHDHRTTGIVWTRWGGRLLRSGRLQRTLRYMYSPFIKRWALALASSRIWRFFVISSYTVQCCEI